MDRKPGRDSLYRSLGGYRLIAIKFSLDTREFRKCLFLPCYYDGRLSVSLQPGSIRFFGSSSKEYIVVRKRILLVSYETLVFVEVHEKHSITVEGNFFRGIFLTQISNEDEFILFVISFSLPRDCKGVHKCMYRGSRVTVWSICRCPYGTWTITVKRDSNATVVLHRDNIRGNKLCTVRRWSHVYRRRTFLKIINLKLTHYWMQFIEREGVRVQSELKCSANRKITLFAVWPTSVTGN